jgi:dipeptidyl aminopeptidase/acylaminoacyl peptidase
MTLNDGFDRTLTSWLDEQAGRGTPGYLDEVLARTTRTRQRPWWSSLERWLPMQSTARFAHVPRAAWLLVILGLIVALGSAILVTGSLRRPPSPFGPAGQGNVLYAAADGDIYAIDTATNQARPLVVGPATDSGPIVSPDGARFAFVRRDAGSATTTTLVANADGSAARELAGMHEAPAWMAWSPDSARLAVAGSEGLWIVGPDVGSTLVTSGVPGTQFFTIEDPQWRPNGHELIFLATAMDTVVQVGLYIIQTDGSGLRAIAKPAVPGPAHPTLSPDGSMVAYSTAVSDHSEIHVVDVATGVDRRVAFDGAAADLRPHWSPDETKLVFERTGVDTYQLMIGSVDGGPVTAIGPTRPDKTGGAEVRFSPDGTRILAFYKADRTSWILEPTGGPGTKLDYDAVTAPTWQGLAP